jgi:ABC-type transport system involved in multi-copper enzyme maturation permease subunit
MPVLLRWLLRLGPTNPIAVRLVQNGSRRTKHMYIRAVYLAVLTVVLLWLMLIGAGANELNTRQMAAIGAQNFIYISYLQIFLICILAPVFMGGAIAQEANPRTWEVLLTTPMTAAEIVLGNLFGRLFFVLALLVCSMPLFALTQYFGGVPGNAILASYLVAGSTALLVGALAIALSVSRLVGKRAFFVFYVAIVTYLGVTLAIDVALRGSGNGSGPTGSGVTPMTAINPFLALYALLNPTSYPKAPEGSRTGLLGLMLETPVQFWCIGSTILSFLFMAASTVTVRLGGLTSLGVDSSGVPWWRRLFGLKPKGAEHRAPKAVWTNPIAWREAASRNSTPAKIVARYIFLSLGGLFGLSLIWLYHAGTLTHTDFQYALLVTVWVEVALIALVGINTAATAISKEREDGTLDLLLTTPITASAYLSGKLRGLIAYLLPLLAIPIGTLLLAGLYVLLGGFSRAGGVTLEKPLGAVGSGRLVTVPVILEESGLIAAIAIIPFMAFCVMVGLHWSLKSRGTLSSVVGTVGIAGAIAGVLGLCAWNAMGSIPDLGAIAAALSPASLLYACVHPWEALTSTISSSNGIGGLHVWLFFGCLISAALNIAICYGIHSNMVRTFDMTVRKLAGNK